MIGSDTRGGEGRKQSTDCNEDNHRWHTLIVLVYTRQRKHCKHCAWFMLLLHSRMSWPYSDRSTYPTTSKADKVRKKNFSLSFPRTFIASFCLFTAADLGEAASSLFPPQILFFLVTRSSFSRLRRPLTEIFVPLKQFAAQGRTTEILFSLGLRESEEMGEETKLFFFCLQRGKSHFGSLFEREIKSDVGNW